MSVPRYPRMRDSGVEWLGEVPEHWDVARIGTLFREVAEPGSAELPILSVSIHHGVSDDEIDPEEMDRKVTRSEDRTKYKRVRANDLVYNMMRAWQGGFGTVQVEGAVSPAYVVARPIADESTRFVELALRTPTAVEEMRRHSAGVTDFRLRLYWDGFKDIRVPLPPLAERCEILAFLERETAKIDGLIEAQRRLIELLGEKRQAVISHAVTKGLDPAASIKDSGVEWLGEVPAHWEVRTISSVSTKITNGYVGPTRDVLKDEGVRYLQSLHIKGNRIRFDSPYYVDEEWSRDHAKSILRAGDVLIVQTGDIGQVAVVPPEFEGCNCHALIIVSPNRHVLSGDWLSWALCSDYGFHSLLSIQTGALHPHLNCGNVKFLSLPIPPLDEQEAIVAAMSVELGKVDELVSEAQNGISLLQERRAALISAAVTGKIDVRGLATGRDVPPERLEAAE